MEGRTFTVHLNDSSFTQNLPPPIFLSVLYYRLHYFPFTSLTCRILHTHSPHPLRRRYRPVSVQAAWYYLPQTQSRCNELTQILLYMETPIKYPQNGSHFIFQTYLPPTPTPSGPHTSVPWVSAVRYLSLVLDSKLLCTKYLHTVAIKATALLCSIFKAPTVQPVNPLQITHSIHSSLRRPCLQFHISFQPPQTPRYPVKVSPRHP